MPLALALLPRPLSNRKWLDDHRLLPMDITGASFFTPGAHLSAAKVPQRFQYAEALHFNETHLWWTKRVDAFHHQALQKLLCAKKMANACPALRYALSKPKRVAQMQCFAGFCIRQVN